MHNYYMVTLPVLTILKPTLNYFVTIRYSIIMNLKLYKFTLLGPVC